MSRRVPNGATEPVVITHDVARMARVYDYLLGGDNHFAIDRHVAEHVCAALPGGIEGARRNIRENRRFLADAVAYLAGDMGLRQFLDLGTGIPNGDNVHAVAQRTAPDARVVYVDYDPVVLAHAHQLLRGTGEGRTAYLHADVREPETILEQAASTLDFSQPVAVLVVGILHYIVEKEDPYGIVTKLLGAVPGGSYLVLSHLASDVQPDNMAEVADRHNQPSTAETVELRSQADVARFFDGVELLQPGVVRLDQWAGPGKGPVDSEAEPEIPIYAGIGRKE